MIQYLEAGTRFNNLIFVSYTEKRQNRKRCALWKCDCGKTTEAKVENVKSGNTASCGCKRTRLNGMWATPTYRSWQSMMSRCGRPDYSNYKNYGGRGIRVCERWKDFNNFVADMGVKPSAKHQIDRIDNDADYEPSNCQWVSPADNIRKKKSTKLTVDKVKRIKELQKAGSMSNETLASMFSVSGQTICDIKHGRTWADVNP